MQNKDLNSHMFEGVYKDLDIDLNKLGCLMLDVTPIEFNIGEELLYYAKDKSRFWIDGYVADKTPHLTLLYGFLKPALEYKNYIQEVLNDWKLDSVKIKSIGYFDSPYQDEDYYCIIAHIEVTPELLEGHQRLEFLPHVNTFNGYKPHITLAYVKKCNLILLQDIIGYFSPLKGKELKVIGLNYGGNK